jgi:dCTP diphosphatase
MTQERYTLEELMALIRDFVHERDWERFQKPASVAMSAAVEIGELLERFQWLTHDEISDLLKSSQYRESVGDEIADVLIYLLRLADTAGISPTNAVLDKMKKNEQKYPVAKWKGRIPDKIAKNQ